MAKKKQAEPPKDELDKLENPPANPQLQVGHLLTKDEKDETPPEESHESPDEFDETTPPPRQPIQPALSAKLLAVGDNLSGSVRVIFEDMRQNGIDNPRTGDVISLLEQYLPREDWQEKGRKVQVANALAKLREPLGLSAPRGRPPGSSSSGSPSAPRTPRTPSTRAIATAPSADPGPITGADLVSIKQVLAERGLTVKQLLDHIEDVARLSSQFGSVERLQRGAEMLAELLG